MSAITIACIVPAPKRKSKIHKYPLMQGAYCSINIYQDSLIYNGVSDTIEIVEVEFDVKQMLVPTFEITTNISCKREEAAEKGFRDFSIDEYTNAFWNIGRTIMYKKISMICDMLEKKGCKDIFIPVRQDITLMPWHSEECENIKAVMFIELGIAGTF